MIALTTANIEAICSIGAAVAILGFLGWKFGKVIMYIGIAILALGLLAYGLQLAGFAL